MHTKIIISSDRFLLNLQRIQEQNLNKVSFPEAPNEHKNERRQDLDMMSIGMSDILCLFYNRSTVSLVY